MTIVSIKQDAGGELRRMELSDGSLFSFKTCYLPPVCEDESLCGPGAEGLEISAAEEEGFRFASSCLRAEKAALRLIARAEQNVFGLARKLEKRGHDAACCGAVVSRLCGLGLLDDSRYARLWLESAVNRQAASPRRLLAGLRSRRISRKDAEDALRAVLDEGGELRLLERYVQKILRKSKTAGGGEGDSRRLKYLLKGEGFSSAAVRDFFDE